MDLLSCGKLRLDHSGRKLWYCWWYMGVINGGMMGEWIWKPAKDFYLDPCSGQICSAASGLSWLIACNDDNGMRSQCPSQIVSSPVAVLWPVSSIYSSKSSKVGLWVFRLLSESSCKNALYRRSSLVRGYLSPLTFDLSPIWAWQASILKH